MDVVTMLVESMHPDHVANLASVVRDVDVEKGSVPRDWIEILSGEKARLLFDSWYATGVTADELVGMLLGAGHAYHSARSEVSIQLVWSGPSTEFVAMRRTEQVLLEIIGATRRRLFLTSFVAYKVVSVVKALSNVMDRGVDVSILLESSERHGGDLSIDSIDDMRNALPRARFYYWKEKDEDFVGGRVHAKTVVADASVCFISSANLTGHGMEKNMEAGVLIRGGDVPGRLQRHLDALVKTGIVSIVE